MDALMYEVQKAYIAAKEANRRFSSKKNSSKNTE